MTAHALLPRRTPLYETHRRLGAMMTDFAGWTMPLRYGSETAEHNAVRTAAGLFDLSHMGEIEVAGPQAARALNYALAGDIAAIPVGKAKYTMMCQPDGGILDDLIVYRLAGARYLVVANGANAAPMLGHPIAIGYVDDALAVPGTAVQVDVRGAPESARVVELPFYRRPRVRSDLGR